MKKIKGFTLIELMVVVAIIGVLSLIGLRVYNDQQNKAKNAIVKSNSGTIQTLIQANIVDTDYNDATGALRVTSALGDISNAAGCRNPYTGGMGNINVIKALGDSLTDGESIDFGKVAVASPGKNDFLIQGLDQDGKLLGNTLRVKK